MVAARDTSREGNAGSTGIWHELRWRQRATLLAHLYKAICKQHHRDLIPLFRELVPSEGIVVDVGAHAGQFTKIFSRIAADGHVFAFEPGGYARLILSTMLRARRRKNVTVIPAALGMRAETLTLSLPLKASGSLGFGLANLAQDDAEARECRRETVPVMTLDNFAAQENLLRLDLIKADIEGWELHMLRGASNTIAVHRPAVLLEVVAHHLRRAGSEPQAVWEYFNGHDYRPHQLENGRIGARVPDYRVDGDYLFLP